MKKHVDYLKLEYSRDEELLSIAIESFKGDVCWISYDSTLIGLDDFINEKEEEFDSEEQFKDEWNYLRECAIQTPLLDDDRECFMEFVDLNELAEEWLLDKYFEDLKKGGLID